MTTSRKIAVLGAGYIGTAVARSLAAAGHEVVAVRRSPSASDAGVRWLAADLSRGLPDGLPAELDAVILTIAPASFADDYAGTYPPAAARAARLARESGAAQLIYTSSTGVYGGEDGEPMTEASPRRGRGPGNAALIEAEDAILDSGLAGATVLRVAGIYGPGRDPRARFLDAARLPMQGNYWVNVAHQHDIVQGIAGALDYTGAPRALNLADGNPALAADVARWMAAARGTDPASLVFGNAAERSRSNQRIVTAALQATGWRPKFPSFREGFTHGL